MSLLIISFGALAFALAPHGLHLLGLPDDKLWRICSAAFLLFGVIAAFTINRVMPPEYFSAQFSEAPAIVAYVISALMALASALNALGVFSASLGVYYLCLVVYLLLGGLQFATIILMRPS